MEMNKAISKNRNVLFSIKIIFLSLIFFNLTSCSDLYEIDSGDTGFSLSIRNFTDIEYVGCKFYMGAYDKNENYIVVDSLIYPDVVIYKNTEGASINLEQGYSTTYPSLDNKNGLNVYGYWEPKYTKIESISGNRDIVFKFELENGLSKITTPINFSNGSLSPTIRAEGISW